MGSIRKQPGRKKPWQLRWREQDGTERAKAFLTRTEAVAFNARVTHTMRSGSYTESRRSQRTLASWAREWMDHRQVSRNTDAAVRSRVSNHLVPALGHLPLAKIEPSHIRSYVKTLVVKELAPSSIRSIVSDLTAVLNSAVESNYIGRSPIPRDLRLPADNADERVFLSPQQADRLEAVIDPYYAPLVHLVLRSGLRWGEVVGLKTSRFHPEKRSVEVVESLTEVHGVLEFAPPKSRASRRVIMLTPSVIDTLSTHLAVYGPGQNDLLFHTRSGGPLYRTNFRKRVWLPAIAKAEVVPAPHFHDLRHTHAAWLIASGAPMKLIQSRLGHNSIRVTMDVYGHLMEGLETEAVDRMDAMLEASRGLSVDQLRRLT